MNAYSTRLVDRVAIVTGASRGIGPAIARRLVAQGARVGLTARRSEALAFLAQDGATWITGQTIVCDGGVSLTGRAGCRMTVPTVGPEPLITACLDSAVRQGAPWR